MTAGLRPRARLRLLRWRARRARRRWQALVAAIRRTVASIVRAGIRAVKWGVRSIVPLAILAILGFGVGAGVAVADGQFGFHPVRNAAAWADRPMTFVGASTCAACHPAEVASWASAQHAGITCESCHGPLVDHAAGGPAPSLLAPSASSIPIVAAADLMPPDASTASRLCLSCHEAGAGRPTGFPTVDPLLHYAGPACIACHDPHTTVAPTPPTILHPLEGLPACTVCHSPSGMRPLPADHPSPVTDCLACHRPVAS